MVPRIPGRRVTGITQCLSPIGTSYTLQCWWFGATSMAYGEMGGCGSVENVEKCVFFGKF
jgi:hypothetical protein